jgi:hypothetical protein
MMSLAAERSTTLGGLEAPQRAWIIGAIAVAIAALGLTALLWPSSEMSFEASPSVSPSPSAAVVEPAKVEPAEVEPAANPEPSTPPEPAKLLGEPALIPKKAKSTRVAPTSPVIRAGPATKKPPANGTGPVKKRELKDW